MNWRKKIVETLLNFSIICIAAWLDVLKHQEDEGSDVDARNHK